MSAGARHAKRLPALPRGSRLLGAGVSVYLTSKRAAVSYAKALARAGFAVRFAPATRGYEVHARGDEYHWNADPLRVSVSISRRGRR